MKRTLDELWFNTSRATFIYPVQYTRGSACMDTERFRKWSGHEYSMKQRLAALFLEAILFLGLIPWFLFVVSSFFDRLLSLPQAAFGVVALVIGLLLVVPGVIFALWSIYVQMTLGRGTPVPVMATQNLVVQKPFTYCRNPMTLGTILLYLGVSMWIGSLSALGLTLLFAVLLLVYIKLVEEKELEMRFGSAYAEYKQKTPFLVPRWGRSQEPEGN